MKRSSGLLLPVSALPSTTAIGNLGIGAEKWLAFLKSSGQRYWALLPLLIPDSVGSPYASPSAFAGNWQMVSPEQLAAAGFLTPSHSKKLSNASINYDRSNIEARQIIGQAWIRFLSHGAPAVRDEFFRYQQTERHWLADYALYMAIKDRFGGQAWIDWPKPFRDRHDGQLDKFRKKHKTEIGYFAFGQWLFDRQWRRVRKLAHESNISVIGDFPYAVALDNADVWRFKKFFKLQLNGRPRRVIGAPPDELSRQGQNWGMPAYDWPAFERDRFSWWIQRLRRALTWYDMVRIDHFRGYRAVWEISGLTTDARQGRWMPVPGEHLFGAFKKAFGRLPFIAEDLGMITEDVVALRNKLGIPGMRVLQFGFHDDRPTFHYPSTYPAHSVAYTGTHDLPTLKTWLRVAPAGDTQRALTYARVDKKNGVYGLIKAGLQSRSHLFIAQAQDLFQLGNTSRINRPGTKKDNWTWRLPLKLLTSSAAHELKALTKLSRRIGPGRLR